MAATTALSYWSAQGLIGEDVPASSHPSHPTVQVASKRGGGTPPIFSSSLDKPETSDPSTAAHLSSPRYGAIDHDDLAPVTPQESAYRHSCWAADRRRVYAALQRTHQSNRRQQSFANCGSSLWLHKTADDLCLTSNHCHDRLCLPCNLSRRARLIESLCLVCADAKAPVRFCTLTLKHNHLALSDQIDRLFSCFRLLRRRPWWKKSVQGGAIFLEIKVGKDGLWHPHFHLLCETHWLDQRELASEWYAVTGDSYLCDVRPMPEPQKRIVYVTKYATKPCDQTVLNFPDKLDEFVCAIKGRRLFQPFGTWKKLLPADSDAVDKSTLSPLGNIHTLAFDAATGDPHAIRYWQAALRKWPGLSVFAPHPTLDSYDAAPP